MAPTTSTPKRTSAKRSSTNRRTSKDKPLALVGNGEGGGDAKTPDTSGAAVTTKQQQEVVEAKEPTLTETLQTEIQTDNVRIFDGDKQVEDGAKHLEGLLHQGKIVAKGVRKSYVNWQRQNGLFADVLIGLRLAIILPTGMPDFGGKSAVYKRLAGMLIDEAYVEGEEPKPTVVNRIQKRTTRGVGLAAAKWINQHEKIGLEDDEVQRIVTKKDKALEGEDGKNDKVVALVQHTNAALNAGSHAANEPDSPFEKIATTRTGGGNTGGQADTSGQRAARNKTEFRVGVMPFLTLDVLSEEILLIAVQFDELMHGPNPQFGEGGKEGVARNIIHAEAILHGLGVETGTSRELNKSEREAREKALAAVA